MSSISIEDLFNNDRFPSGLNLLLLLLYCPLGVCLVVVRFFIGIQAVILAWILPKYSSLRLYALRVICAVLGVLVTREELSARQPEACVLVANYTSALDHLAISLVEPNVMPSVWDLPFALMKILGYVDMGAKEGRETLIRKAKKHCRECSVPLLAFPEGAFTNGKAGLLKFSIWPFSLEKPIQPLVLELKRPLIGNVSVSVLGGRWWIDIFWFLFVPYTCYHIKVLEVVEEQEDETVEEFTKRVQTTMATTMGLVPTDFTSADKVDYAKKKFIISPSAGASHEIHSNSPEEMMVQQVLEVLPHVPPQSILEDLALTKDVDLTITNILEGRVHFTPIEPPTAATPTSTHWHKSSSSTNTKAPPTTSSKTFGKNHQDRHMSLKERKNALYEYARNRYLEKRQK